MIKVLAPLFISAPEDEELKKENGLFVWTVC
jgi:hypothetical protein